MNARTEIIPDNAKSAILGESARYSFWASAEHLALISSLVGGFLVFCGMGYYKRLFAEFALDPGLVEISNFQLIAKGVDCSFYSLIQLVVRNWYRWGLSIVIGSVIGLILIACLWHRGGMALLERIEPVNARVGRWTMTILKWNFAILLASTGFLAGSNGGGAQASYLQQVRANPTNCYALDGKLYSGVILAQDRQRTVLIRPDRTMIVDNSKLNYVIACDRY